jgi:capsular exopolysaccharide synthesis family protein
MTEADKLKNLKASAEGRAFELQSARSQEATLRRDVENNQKLLDETVAKLKEMSALNDDVSRTKVQIIEPASNGLHVGPFLLKTLIQGAFVGGLLGVSIAFVIDRADRRVATTDQMRSVFGQGFAASIPRMGSKDLRVAEVASHVSPAVQVFHRPKSHIAERFRTVRTSLFFAEKTNNVRVVQITSPHQGDGKTTVAANLAVAIAQAGKRVILIDADLRRPAVFRAMGIDNSRGLAQVLGEDANPDDVILETDIPGLHVMPTGGTPHNPSELFTTTKFDELLNTLKVEYDYVLVDTPPLLVVSDARIVATRVDGVVVVMQLGHSRMQELVACRDELAAVDASVLGVVANRCSRGQAYGYGYGYGYYGSYYGSDAEGPPEAAESNRIASHWDAR